MTETTGETSSDQDARLLAFFEARLDEDEALARKLPRSWRQIGTTGVIVASDGHRAEECANGNWSGIAEHIVRHDPTRVLAEIRIKRYLISEYRSVEHFDEKAAVEAAMRLGNEQAAMTAVGQAWAKEAARTLLLAVIKAEASLWALHPEYEAAWSLWPHVRAHGVTGPVKP